MSKKEYYNKTLEDGDGILSAIYWRKKYNTLIGEHELLKEVMRDDVYQKTIKSIERPLELARYKRENTRLRNQLNVIREERDNAISELKKYKK